MWGKPQWNSAPFTAEVESEVVDSAIEPLKAVRVLVVVKGGTGLRETLMGECVLEL